MEFIEQNKDRPFYLHYCSTLLHGGANSWRKFMDFPLVSGEEELKTLPAVMTLRDELLKRIAAAGFKNDKETAGEAWIACPALANQSRLRIGSCGLERIHQAETEAELKALRRSAHGGMPFGETIGQRATAKRLGLESSLRATGRPRRQSDKP